MAVKIEVTSDGTTKGTVLKVDGVEITKDEEVVSIDFYASGSATWPDGYKSPGGVSLHYRTMEEDNGTKGVSYNYSGGNSKMVRTSIGEPKDSDGQYVGKESPKVTLIDTLLALAKEKKVDVVEPEKLMERTMDSLNDTIEDLKAI